MAFLITSEGSVDINFVSSIINVGSDIIDKWLNGCAVFFDATLIIHFEWYTILARQRNNKPVGSAFVPTHHFKMGPYKSNMASFTCIFDIGSSMIKCGGRIANVPELGSMLASTLPR